LPRLVDTEKVLSWCYVVSEFKLGYGGGQRWMMTQLISFGFTGVWKTGRFMNLSPGAITLPGGSVLRSSVLILLAVVVGFFITNNSYQLNASKSDNPHFFGLDAIWPCFGRPVTSQILVVEGTSRN